MKETFTFSIFGQSKSWKNYVVVAIPTKKEKFSQCKALLFIIIITNEKPNSLCIDWKSWKIRWFQRWRRFAICDKILDWSEAAAKRVFFCIFAWFSKLHFQWCWWCFHFISAQKNFSLPRSFKRIAQCAIKPFLRKATYDQLIGIHWQIIHCVREIFRKLASIPFMLRRLSFLSTGFSTRCDDANEKSWALQRQSELLCRGGSRKKRDWLTLTFICFFFATKGSVLHKSLLLLSSRKSNQAWIATFDQVTTFCYLTVCNKPSTHSPPPKNMTLVKHFLLEKVFCSTHTKGLLLPQRKMIGTTVYLCWKLQM